MLFHLILTLFMVAVMFYDALKYIIPNAVVGMLALLYVVFAFITPDLDWLGGIYAMLALLVVGYAIFAVGIAGAGDGKFLAVCGLWCGWNMEVVQFIIYMSIIGGLMSLVLIIGRPLGFWIVGRFGGSKRIPRIMEKDAPIPYGIAIAGSFLYMLWQGVLPGLALAN